MSANSADKDQMLMNWPERVWIYSPFRPFFQRREIARWLRIAGPREVETALEIGCGLGRGAALLADKMNFQWTAAFDIEDILVRRSARWLPARLRSRISFYTGDAQDLPFGDAAFDAVVNFGIIHHVLDWRRCLREIGRVTRDGGVFYFEEIYPPLYANFILKRMLRHPTEDRFNGPQFVAELERNGFCLLNGVKTDSKFGIVGAAVKR